MTIEAPDNFSLVRVLIKVSAVWRCVAPQKKIDERYWVPLSFPYRLGIAGS